VHNGGRGENRTLMRLLSYDFACPPKLLAEAEVVCAPHIQIFILVPLVGVEPT
jgi:hypothetical protein